jgi:hypothetical protein
MLRRWIVLAILLTSALAMSGCSDGSEPTATSDPTVASTATPAASAGQGSAAHDDYQQALKAHACYADSFDAADDPLGKDVACADQQAGFRLVGIQAAAAGDCPPNQVLVSEKSASADAVPPSLCLEPVTH